MPEQIRGAVSSVLANNIYRENIEALSKEFSDYPTMELCEKKASLRF